MVANNVKTVYRLTNGANEDFIGNLTNNNNGKKKTTKSNNKEISTNSHLLHQCRSYVKNVFDETEGNIFDQQNVDEGENNFISNSYTLLIFTLRFQKLKVVLMMWSCLLS